MDNRNSGAAGSGITLGGLTFIVFLVLKLCKVIDWSWWWVTAPLWIPIALFVGICGVVIVVAFFVGVISYIIKSVRGRD
jgi:hypothetical protein